MTKGFEMIEHDWDVPDNKQGAVMATTASVLMSMVFSAQYERPYLVGRVLGELRSHSVDEVHALAVESIVQNIREAAVQDGVPADIRRWCQVVLIEFAKRLEGFHSA